MKRKRIGEEKSRCIITFIIPFQIKFSISGTETERQFLEKYSDEHNGQDISQIFKDEFLKKMGAKTLDELSNMEKFFHELEDLKRKCFNEFGVTKKNSFSKIMKEDVVCKKEE